LPSVKRARRDETGCGVLLTLDYERTIDQLVKSFDHLVAVGVDAAKGSLVSQVAQCAQPGDEDLAVGLAGGPLPGGLLGQQGPGVDVADELVSGNSPASATAQSSLPQAVIAVSRSSIRLCTRRVISSSSDTETRVA
jgi:hypothetical protein